MPRHKTEGPVSRWCEWDRQRKITENKLCSNCGALIYWRRNKTGLCNPCAVKRKGVSSPSWKGGRKINRGGYVEVYHVGHHNRGKQQGAAIYVLEHVLVWEKANGKPLPQGFVIHHLNGIKTDNRPENLLAIQPSNHGGWTYTHSLQARIRELEEIIARLS